MLLHMQAFYSKTITVGFEISTQSFLRVFSFSIDEGQGSSLVVVSTCVIRLFTWALNLEVIISEGATTGQFLLVRIIYAIWQFTRMLRNILPFLRNIVFPSNFTLTLLDFAINQCRKPAEFHQQHANNFCKIQILMLFV